MNRRIRAAAALILAAAFVAVPSTANAAAAQLPSTGIVPGGTFEDMLRRINVPGSVIAGAAPTSFAAEQMGANAVRSQFYDLIDREFTSNLDRSAARGELGRTGYYTRANGVRVGNGVPFRPPAVRPTPLASPAGAAAKFVGPVGAGLLGWTIGTAGGRMVSEAMGLNPEGGLCRPGFEDLGMIAFITGQECPDVLAQTADWLAYVGTLTGVSGGLACSPGPSNYCVQLVGKVPFTNQRGTHTAWCLAWSGTRATGSSTADSIAYFIGGSGGNVGGYPGWDRLAGVIGATSNEPTSAPAACGTAFPGLVGGGGGSVGNENLTPFTQYAITTGTTMGEPQAITSAGSDAMQQVQCRITDQNGGTYLMMSDQYLASGGSIATPKCPELAGGLTPSRIELAEVGPNGTTQLADQQTTPAFRDWLTAYPQCADGSCALDLVRLSSGTQVSCFENDTACVDWFNDPAKGENYLCTYGGSTLPLSECNLYQGVFDPARLAVGAPYSDPTTGTWSGGQTAPNTTGSTAMATTIQNPDAQRSCMPSGWGVLNPLEWVVKPMQCVLEWAFVPRPTVLAYEQAAMGITVAASPFGAFNQSLHGLTTIFETESSCGGLPFALQMPAWGVDFEGRLFAACTEPWAGVAAVVRNLLIGVLCIGGLLAVVRYGAGVFGYIGAGAQPAESGPRFK